MTIKKSILAAMAVMVIIIVVIVVWKNLASSTRIGFVNYQPITLGQIGKANDNSFIKIENLSVDNLTDANNYDMIFINGMGLRITEKQRTYLQEAADKGIPMLSTAVTNPDNMIVSTDSVDSEFLKQYLHGGGKENYRSMLNYVRKFIDNKKLFINNISDPAASPTGLFYHPDVKDPSKDNVYFNTLKDYRQYLADNRLLKTDAPEIILTGQMGIPDELIASLESTGNIVYPITNLQRAIMSGMTDSISPAAMINMAHGRMGDMVVGYLKRVNIPLFAPLNVNRDYEEWKADKMGMSGGFLSQSVVTPEIDGAICPWSLFAQFAGEDGVPEIKAIPERLEEFVKTVNNYISLRKRNNADKKVAIFYFKGPGQNSLVAEGMEVVPSLYNLLNRLKESGYNVAGLPASVEDFERMIAERGKVFGRYAIGEMQRFVKDYSPKIITANDYKKWAESSLSKEMIVGIEQVDGPFPGGGLKTEKGELAIACLTFGNIVLIPQTSAGVGDDEFKNVHGTDMAPPHAYVASYLWARHGFKADALIHFGAHGSLEFTPRKQVALGSDDWSDRLIGTMPHIYIYSTSNVGEAIIAKRRSYAGIVNYLTPPFMESNVRGIYKNLSDAIADYNKEAEAENPDKKRLEASSRIVKKYTVELGIHRELRLDSTLGKLYSPDEIARIENFAEELANEKITGSSYILGVPYSKDKLSSTTYAMTVDPVAYSLYALDKLRGKADGRYDGKGALFTRKYLMPAKALLADLLAKKRDVTDMEICRIAGISQKELDEARQVMDDVENSKDMMSKMMVMGSSMSVNTSTSKLAERKQSHSDKMGKMMKAKSHPKAGMMSAPKHTQQEIDKATAISELEHTIHNVSIYHNALKDSPENELNAIINALNGGYIPPTPGGDPVLNPMILPTGRNMFAVNAEETPSTTAWEKGKTLAENTIKMYRETHGDSIPRKVSYTLWSSEFIETEGATIAQVLYMLGVEPVRDPFGRVTDLRLIPSEKLGRPRIDVVVQTSGQLRDIAASRLFLISRAVEMAYQSTGDKYPNYVSEGVVESERHLVDKGVSPKEARELSTARVFGGINGNYGSGIQEMVEAGGRWDDDSQIAETYIHNMGATYGSETDWEQIRDFAFEAALTRTDVVVQPRQSNTWGALSLDHVYEFMGGMNLAVRKVTGKDPDAYLADYRNRNRTKMQEVKEAVGVESRTTILNPVYIKEKMKGGAGDASSFADIVRNTYGWNVMKPDIIDNELWNDIYDTYIMDKHNLGTKQFFASSNPAAMEEITAIMLETARKGMWKASESQVRTLARLHTEFIKEHGPSCSGFVCDNTKLKDYIKNNVDDATASDYSQSIGKIRSENQNNADSMVMERNEMNSITKNVNRISGTLVAVAVVIALIVIFIIVRRRRNQNEE